MPLLEQLKTDLAEVIDNYQQKEKTVDAENSKAIEDIGYLIEDAQSAMELRRLSEWRVNKMKGLFLGRFRNDLRFQLLKILHKSDYDKFLLIAEDNERLRIENEQQKKENNETRELLKQYHLVPEDLRNLGEKLRKLEVEVSDYKEKYETEKKASETYQQQIALLSKSVTKLESDNSKLKTELETTKEEKDAFARKCQEHIEEKARLAEKVAQLEAALGRSKESLQFTTNNGDTRPTSNYANFYNRPKAMAT